MKSSLRLLTVCIILAAYVGVSLQFVEASPSRARHFSEVPGSLQNDRIKGVYVSYFALGSTAYRQRVRALIEATQVNAVVLDFKNDFGLLTFPSQVVLAQEIGADRRPTVADPREFLSWFQQRRVYTIARIVVFKDEPLAVARPEWAVKDGPTGELWRDREGLGWADPLRAEVAAYNVALALEAARLGFDEVQFDYVRFPSDGAIGQAVYAQELNQALRLAAIAGFLEQAHAALSPLGVKVAADVFGYVTWREDDMGIGQQIEALAPHLDVLSPMLYPSTFASGLPRAGETYTNAVAYPYEIVYLSTQRAVARAAAVNPALEIRPWLQDFRDYAFDGRAYGVAELRSQMAGAHDAGAPGWLLWDPAVSYTVPALVWPRPSRINPPRQE